MDWDALINEAHALNEQHGTNIKGKKYSGVNVRLELFRRRFGDDLGLETEIVSLGKIKGEPVVVRAVIRRGDRIVSTGHAGEIIGSTNINATSALENCETSAIGRALAALGLHGGEMASLEELRPKAEAPSVTPVALPPELEPVPFKFEFDDVWEEHAVQRLSEAELENPELVARAFADCIKEDAESYKTVKGLDGYMGHRKKQMGFVERHAPHIYSALRSAVIVHRTELQAAKEAAE
jgi:hypothetical protein